ncbi:class I SAM-dependent methyltransferase [Veillonella atypica]|nr:class I SAM-dependent methyltransferase [Veillonella atypica]
MASQNNLLICVNSTWLKKMDFNNPVNKRKTDDTVESKFWQNIANRYTKDFNINSHTTLVADKIKSLISPAHSMLEIGAGSGNFTIKLAEHCKSIYCVDFSLDMICAMHTNLEKHNIHNVFPTWGKFENITSTKQFDYVLSVNSLYRIQDISAALSKINDLSKVGFIIVRTIQRSPFFKLYEQLNLDYYCCQDYKLLPLELWNLGINANVEYVEYTKKIVYTNLDEIINQILLEIGAETYNHNITRIQDYINSHIQEGTNAIVWNTDCTAVFMYYFKS